MRSDETKHIPEPIIDAYPRMWRCDVLNINSTYGKFGTTPPLTSSEVRERFDELYRLRVKEQRDNKMKHDLTTARGILMALASGEKLCGSDYPPHEYIWMNETGKILTERNEPFNIRRYHLEEGKLRVWEEPKPKRKIYQWVVKGPSGHHYRPQPYYTDEEANERFGDRVVARLDDTMIEVE